MKTKTLIAPERNLNGTSADALIRQYTDAAAAVHDAWLRMAETAPHGRDFPRTVTANNIDRYRAADAQHRARMDALRNVYNELAALADAVDDRRPETLVEVLA